MSGRTAPVWLCHIGFVTFPEMSDADLDYLLNFETWHVLLTAVLTDEAEVRKHYLEATWRLSEPCAPDTSKLN